MMDFIVILILIFWLGVTFSFCDKEHVVGFNKTTKIGRFELWTGIEKPEYRDIGAEFCFCPFYYFTFAISLWTFYFTFVYDRNLEQYPDCGNDENAECYVCGRKKLNKDKE